MSCNRQYSAARQLYNDPIIRCISRSQSLGRRRYREEGRAVRLYGRGLEVVVGQQAVVDVVVAFFGARAFCLLFCNWICESRGRQSGNEGNIEIHLVIVR